MLSYDSKCDLRIEFMTGDEIIFRGIDNYGTCITDDGRRAVFIERDGKNVIIGQESIANIGRDYDSNEYYYRG